MNKQQMHEAMRISIFYYEANEAAKKANQALSTVRQRAEYFLTKDEIYILRAADKILDSVIDKSNTWKAAKYAAATLTENPSLT